MFLDPAWRILTVGDGDLSFSASLARHHKPAALCASVYDSLDTLTSKYRDHALKDCMAEKTRVLERFDVTQEASWQRLEHASFDLVIFQFPLIPAFGSKQEFASQTRRYDLNTLNRALLHTFIRLANQYALDKNGAGLCYITSKDVKPYREWNLEGSLTRGLEQRCLGQMPFDVSAFPGYRVRNVDRDKHVKDTSGITYVYGRTLPQSMRELVSVPEHLGKQHCALCRAGPFMTEQDKLSHEKAKKHQQMLRFESLWQDWLSD